MPTFPPLLAAALLAVAAPATDADPAALVDVFIGTGGHGHTHPAATRPFGMVQLGPDTRRTGWDGCSGYHFTDRTLHGFSHTHLSGTGIADYADVLLLPGTGPAGAPDGSPVPFDKRSERASPGSYAVRLPEAGIDVELTASERCGFHRYVFPARAAAHVTVDLEYRDRVVASVLRVVNEYEIEGMRRSSSWAENQVVWFVARFSRPITSFALYDGDERRDGVDGIKGGPVRGVFSFGDGGGELLARVGISAVDLDGARGNLDAELGTRPFDEVREEARAAWNDALGAISVAGGTDEQRTIFTTALYHSLVAPNVWSDVDGRYLGMDGRVHAIDGARRYTVFSLWDTFRATHPLFTLIEPERTREFVETFLGMFREHGRLPVWELAANETDCMIGNHSISVIADAWAKGIRGYDGNAALDAMVHTANLDHFGLAEYRRQGFVSADATAESVSRTLEYAYDDWCIARMAQSLSRFDVAAEFDRRAQAWRHLLDPETGFFRARSQQMWVEPFDPARVDIHYTEANAWQYGLFVPHDVEGLMDALGGDGALIDRLDTMFLADTTTTGREQADITGRIGQYAHGNEPSHHMAWLYHYAGRPDRSARGVRRIMDAMYAAAPEGLSGNEDCGQMSSWYVLSALGLYPVCPGGRDWLIGVPLFDKATLRVDGGKRFTIETEGEGAIITAARLNGKRLPRSFLWHEEIVRGGVLRLTRGHTPTAWGTAENHRPHSRLRARRVPAAPYLTGASASFRDSVTVRAASADASAGILWAAGDGAPDWRPMTGPLTFHETTRLRLVAELDFIRSPVVTTRLYRLPNDWTVSLARPPAPQYSAGGPESLVDGLPGELDWRIGGWHGWENDDFEAVVDLRAPRSVHAVGAGFLQDVRSWIWMPSAVEIAISLDGASWTTLPAPGFAVAEEDYDVQRRELVAHAGGATARFVRVRATTVGTCPPWHPGAGGDAWIFVDEIVVR
ncbi:GH92 family glycosyl hydrolase [bacterium]|nr:GH92 family glycosyl hydrolase [bacterium]